MLRIFVSLCMLLAGGHFSCAQFLHFGLGGSVKKMSFVSEDALGDSTYTLYFSNIENESLKFDGFDKQNEAFFAPSVYIRYSAKNDAFVEGTLSVNRPKAVARYQNSVPPSEFNETFNSEIDSLGNTFIVADEDQFPFNRLTLRWTFIESSLHFGYNFLRTKLVRPFAFGGIAVRYRMAMNLDDFPQDRVNINRDGRTKTLFNSLDTFKNWTFYYSAGAGLRYQQVALHFFWGRTIGSSDNNSLSTNTSLNVPVESDEVRISNYTSNDVFGVTLSVDLFTLNLLKKDVKQKIRNKKF
ncbi:MAG: hypothetical protein AAGA66_05340 [Bacteroidota bacterium]